MGHLEKHDALPPLSPPRQKYLENVKKVKKTTKICIPYYNRLLRKLQILLFFSLFSRFQGIFGGGGGGGEGVVFFQVGHVDRKLFVIRILINLLKNK